MPMSDRDPPPLAADLGTLRARPRTVRRAQHGGTDMARLPVWDPYWNGRTS